MPSPSSTLATQRPDLAESFFEFDLMADQAGFIAHQVFPIIETQSQAGNFGKIPLEQLLKEADTLRAPGASYARDDFQFEVATFATQEHGAESPVDERERRMYAEYFDAELVATQRAFSKVLRNAERRVADTLFNSTTWTGSDLATAVSTEWSNAAGATPIDDVEAAVQKVYDASGLWPNALVINRKVFRNLRNVDQVIDRINSAGAGDKTTASQVTIQQLAEVFDLDFILVGGSSRNSAAEGQTATPAQIWSSEFASVCRIATTQDFREPAVGRTFHWSEDGSAPGGTVEQYYEEARRSDFYRVRHDVDEVLLYKEAAHLLSNITA